MKKFKFPNSQKINIEDIHIQINQLHSQLASLYKANIQQTEHTIFEIGNSLKKAHERKNRIQLKLAQQMHKPTAANKQKSHIEQLNVNELNYFIKAQSINLKNFHKLLIQQKKALIKQQMEEQALKNSNNQKLKTLLVGNTLTGNISDHINPAKKPANLMLLNQFKTPASSSLITTHSPAKTQLTRPPMPTDGPDQFQVEIDLKYPTNSNNSKTICFNQNPRYALSAFANYLTDDEIDADPEM